MHGTTSVSIVMQGQNDIQALLPRLAHSQQPLHILLVSFLSVVHVTHVVHVTQVVHVSLVHGETELHLLINMQLPQPFHQQKYVHPSHHLLALPHTL